MTGLIPPDTASCPRCAGEIAMVEQISDTLTEDVRTWVCVECAAGGLIALVLTVSTGTTPASPPPRWIVHRHTNAMRSERVA